MKVPKLSHTSRRYPTFRNLYHGEIIRPFLIFENLLPIGPSDVADIEIVATLGRSTQMIVYLVAQQKVPARYMGDRGKRAILTSIVG